MLSRYLYQSYINLPVVGKVFEKILFNSIFRYFQDNDLLWDKQSALWPSDSCDYQLLSIVHDIYASFDTPVVFYNILVQSSTV